jgi:hypothetical protein
MLSIVSVAMAGVKKPCYRRDYARTDRHAVGTRARGCMRSRLLPEDNALPTGFQFDRRSSAARCV